MLYGGRYRRWRIFVSKTVRKWAQLTLQPKILPPHLGVNDTVWEVMTFFLEVNV